MTELIKLEKLYIQNILDKSRKFKKYKNNKKI